MKRVLFIFLLVSLLWGSFACSKRREAVVHREISLFTRFPQAQLRSPIRGILPVRRYVSLGGRMRPILYAPAGSCITYPSIEVLPGASLTLELALDPRASGSPGRAGIRVAARFEGEEETELFRESLPPSAFEGSSGILERIVPLSKVEGKKIALSLELERAEGGAGVIWINPRILSQGKGVRVREDGPPNLVLVIIDTLRADRLGCYGYPDARTENMDRLAREGVIFRRAYSQIPVTGPSHSAIFTSRYPHEIPVRNNVEPLNPGHPTLAELFRDGGFLTGAVVSLSVLGGEFGFSRGFQYYFDTQAYHRYWNRADQVNQETFQWVEEAAGKPFFLWVHYSDPHEPYLPSIHGKGMVLEAVLNGRLIGDVDTSLGAGFDAVLPLKAGENILSFRSKGRGKPVKGRRIAFEFRSLEFHPPVVFQWGKGWFEDTALFFGQKRRFMEEEASLVLNASKEQRTYLSFLCYEFLTEEESSKRYDEEVAFTDRELGRLMEKLKALGLERNTLVVLTADHGEGLGDHRGYLGHADQLYEGQIAIPLIFHFPSRLKPREVFATVRSIDILPTLADFFSLPRAEDARGASLLPWLEGGAGPEDLPVFGETFKEEAREDRFYLREGPWKLILNLGSNPVLEGYHTGRDPRERDDLISSGKEFPGHLFSRLESFRREAEKTPVQEESSRRKHREMLKKLGYYVEEEGKKEEKGK